LYALARKMPTRTALRGTRWRILASRQIGGTISVAPLDVQDTVAVVVLGAAGFGLSTAAIVGRSGASQSIGFLFGDEGHNLLVAHTLLSGGSLYSSVFYPYGPIPAYAHAAAAWIFGNTPLAYLFFLAAVSALNVGLAYTLIRRAANRPVAVFVAVMGVLPLGLVPGSLVGGYTVSAYIPIERTMLLLVALAWTGPGGRSLGRSILIGCLLGAWQGVRFGGAAVAGGAILVIDAVSVGMEGPGGEGAARRGFRMASLRAWAGSLLAIGAAFCAVEVAWTIYAFSTLPRGPALDVLWPWFMLQSYSWVPVALRWLSWGGWRLMLGQYLLPLSAVALGLVGLRRWSAVAPGSATDSRVRSAWADQGAVFVLMCFYGIGCCFYFRMVHHFRGFLWALVPAAAWELQRRGGVVRAGVACLWFPGFATMLRAILAPAVAVSPLVTVRLPSGGAIHTSAPMPERIRFLDRFAAEVPGAPVLFVPGRYGSASGWYYAYHVAHATRHTWFFAPNLIRPYEEAAFIEALSRTVAFIECDDDQGNGVLAGRGLDLVFPPAVSRVILSRMEPWKSEAGCRIHHLR
jgi:hypothetical protein